MEHKTASQALAGIFCLLIGGGFAASVLLPDRDFLENENRVPAHQPRFSLAALASGSFARETEAYVTDQFPLRDAAMALHAAAERTLGKTQIGDVYFGADGALYQQAPAIDEARLAKNIEAVEHFAQTVEQPVSLSLIPTAAEVYREHLPHGAPSENQHIMMERVRTALQNAQWINCASALYAQKASPLFYQTDHHWTSLGAYYGGQALLQGWGMAPRPLESYGESESVSKTFYGTLARTAGAPWVPRDEITRIATPNVAVRYSDGSALADGALYAPELLETTDQYRYFLGGSHALVTITGGKPEGERLLVLRDSYADSLAPFLASDFAEVHLLDLRYSKLSASEYAREHGIDRVLLLYSAPNFAADTNLGFLR